MMKASCPSKSGFAVYENPGPCTVTLPNSGGAVSFRLLMATEPYFRPLVHVLPLAICISQLTASDLRAYGGMREKTHESAKAGSVRSSSAPRKFVTNHIAVRLSHFPMQRLKRRTGS